MPNIQKSIICLAFLYCLAAPAQSNLAFNQVILVTTTDTVPPGKVWKIESVGREVGGSYSSPSQRGENVIIVNGIYLEFNTMLYSSHGFQSGQYNGSEALSYGSGTTLPFWLPAGTIVAVGVRTKMISIIEFNIVP